MEYRAIFQAANMDRAKDILKQNNVGAHVIEAAGCGHYQIATHDLEALRDWFFRQDTCLWYGPVDRQE